MNVAAISGRSPWVQGRKGITGDLNGIFFVEVLRQNRQERLVQICTRPDAGKHDIGPAQTFWIEPELLYPLVKGASDFSACHFHREHELFAIVPNRGIVAEAYREARQLVEVECIHARRYFATYEDLLRQRSTFRGRMKNAPYYAIYNVGEYTFAPWKVIWAEQKQFCACVVSTADVPSVGERPFVPDHKIFFAEFEEAEPAYFLCALLNSNLATEFVRSHTISIQIGDIFKHMTLPEYRPSVAIHRRIVELARRCHAEADDDTRAKLLDELQTRTDSLLA